ncbi:hypothetical protein Tco_0713174 [Tanacetum coccineum]
MLRGRRAIVEELQPKMYGWAGGAWKSKVRIMLLMYPVPIELAGNPVRSSSKRMWSCISWTRTNPRRQIGFVQHPSRGRCCWPLKPEQWAGVVVFAEILRGMGLKPIGINGNDRFVPSGNITLAKVAADLGLFSFRASADSRFVAVCLESVVGESQDALVGELDVME